MENKYIKDAMHHVFRELQILNNSEIPFHPTANKISLMSVMLIISLD